VKAWHIERLEGGRVAFATGAIVVRSTVGSWRTTT
jgi:hypothetical protein